MIVCSSFDALPPVGGSCVTIGNFDGVHTGHKALIQRTCALAQSKGLVSSVITFWPHPRVVLAGSHAPALLTTHAERQQLLSATGAHLLLELPFTLELAALTPEDFICRLLTGLNMKALVVGYDFSLGRGRAGNFDVLYALGQRYGFSVERLDPVYVCTSQGQTIVSSTKVRDAVFNGAMPDAALLLGQPYAITAPVVHGFGRGQGLGFPTANIAKPEQLVPRRGVYATRILCEGQQWQAVTNVGHNPTFDGGALSIESFLLNADVNLYGKTITIQFIRHLRDEQKFPSVEALQARIAIDVAEAGKILGATA